MAALDKNCNFFVRLGQNSSPYQIFRDNTALNSVVETT